MVKRADNTRAIRRGVVAATAVVVTSIVAFGIFYREDVGEPYRTLDRPDGTGPVRVVEYFSYTCPHCRNWERAMRDWPATLPAGVVFEQVHVAYSKTERTLARAHLALKRHDALEANHERIFDAIHDRNQRLGTAAALADFVQGHGVDRETFLSAMRSPVVARQVAAGERAFAALELGGVPALVVDGKHVINMGLGRRGALNAAAALAGELAAKRVE